MKRTTIGLLVLAGIAYVAWGEYRMQRVENTVREIKGTVEELKTEKIQTSQKFKYTQEEEHCLALNIFYEAGVENEMGKLAVGHVTLNRLRTGRWGHNLCSVVYAKAQFSWTLNKPKKPTKNNPLWVESQHVAKAVLEGVRISTLDGSLYYHTDYIKTPKWVLADAKVDQIGQHIFYTKAKVIIVRKLKTKV